MGRIINTEGAGKQRIQLTRSVVLALRELTEQPAVNAQTRDLVAYISIALMGIARTIDQSVEAWEKRGYWLKADRYRLDWAWADKLAADMRGALLSDDWDSVANIAAQIAGKLKDVDVPKRHRIGTPWTGAWEKFNR